MVSRLLFVLTLLCGAAMAQNTRFDNIAWGPRGPIPGATIAVCTQPANTSTTPCTPLANLCSSITDVVCGQPNPVIADSLGNYHFYAQVGQGPFTIQIFGPAVAAPYIMTDQAVLVGTLNTVVKSINNVQYADQFAGADWCAKVVAAQAALPSSGGIINATGFSGVQPTCTAGITIGTLSKPVQLLLGAAQYTLANQMIISPASKVIGLGENSSNSGTWPSRIIVSGGFPTSTPVVQFYNGAAAFNTGISDVAIECASIAGCIGIDTGSAQEGSIVSHVLVNQYMGKCINVPFPSQNFPIERVECYDSASAAAGTNGVVITGNGSPSGTGDNIQLSDISITPAGARTGAGVLCTSCQMSAQRIHADNYTDGIKFDGTLASGIVIGATTSSTSTNVVHISSTVTGSVDLHSLRKFNATNTVKNDIAAFNHVCADESLTEYSLGAGTNPALHSTCTTLANRSNTVTFANLPAAPNGSQIFCSDCNATCTAGAGTGRTCFRENGAWIH